jgi:hypothetical protein
VAPRPDGDRREQRGDEDDGAEAMNHDRFGEVFGYDRS